MIITYARNRRAMMLFSALIIFAVIMTFCVPAQAVTMKSEQQKVNLDYQKPSQNAESPSFFWMMVQMLLALGLIAAMAWGAIQLLGKKLGNRVQGRWMRVLDEVTLGPNRGIVTIEIGGQAFVVGVTDHQISLLMEVHDQQLVEEMLAAGYEERPLQSSVLENIPEWLRTKLAFNKTKPTNDFHHLMDDKVRSLERMSSRLTRLESKKSLDTDGEDV